MMSLLLKGLVFYEIDFGLNQRISQYRDIGYNADNCEYNFESNLSLLFIGNQ